MKQKVTPFTSQYLDHLCRLNLLCLMLISDAVLSLCYTGAQMLLQLSSWHLSQ